MVFVVVDGMILLALFVLLVWAVWELISVGMGNRRNWGPRKFKPDHEVFKAGTISGSPGEPRLLTDGRQFAVLLPNGDYLDMRSWGYTWSLRSSTMMAPDCWTDDRERAERFFRRAQIEHFR